jgi:hypothetical protein
MLCRVFQPDERTRNTAAWSASRLASPRCSPLRGNEMNPAFTEDTTTGDVKLVLHAADTLNVTFAVWLLLSRGCSPVGGSHRAVSTRNCGGDFRTSRCERRLGFQRTSRLGLAHCLGVSSVAGIRRDVSCVAAVKNSLLVRYRRVIDRKMAACSFAQVSRPHGGSRRGLPPRSYSFEALALASISQPRLDLARHAGPAASPWKAVEVSTRHEVTE